MMMKNKEQALVEFVSGDAAINFMSTYTNYHPTIRGVDIYPEFSWYQELHRSSRAFKYDGDQPSPILLVTIHNPRYPITVDVLGQVFHDFNQGKVEKVSITSPKFGPIQALIKFSSVANSTQAKKELDGQNIYDNCCTLEIHFSKDSDILVKVNGDQSFDFKNPNVNGQYGYEYNGKDSEIENVKNLKVGKTYNWSLIDTEKYVDTMMDALKVLDQIVPSKFGLKDYLDILREVKASRNPLKQQFITDFIGDSIRPLVLYILKECNSIDPSEFLVFTLPVAIKNARNLEYARTFNTYFNEMNVRVAMDDMYWSAAKKDVTDHWEGWKETAPVKFRDGQTFVSSQVRIVFRCNRGGDRLVNGFSCQISKYVYDNLERDSSRAVPTLVHEMAHNSTKDENGAKGSKDETAVKLLTHSPIMRDKAHLSEYVEKIKELACRDAIQASVKAASGSAATVSDTDSASASVVVSSPSSSVITDFVSSSSSSSVNSGDPYGQEIRPHKVPKRGDRISGITGNNLKTLTGISVGSYFFTITRRRDLAEGGVLYEFLFHGGVLPEVPDPFCFDTNGLPQIMMNTEY